MTLGPTRLEKTLRVRIKTALRADMELRRPKRRAPKIPWPQRPTTKVIARILFSCVFATFMAAVYRADRPPATQSAAAALWFAAGVLIFRFRILSILYDLPALTALALLPAPKDLIFRWQRARVLHQLWRPLCDALVMLIVIAAFNDAGAGAWLAILPLALLAAVAILAVATWLTFVPLPGQTVWLPFALFFLIIVLGQSKTWGGWLLALFVKHCETISLLSPGGWVARAYLGLLAGDAAVAFVLLALSAAVAASLACALGRWKRGYEPNSFALWYSFGEPPAEWKAVVNAQLESLPTIPGPTKASEAACTREFLEPAWPSNETGWIEKRVARWLTRRERAIIEFAALNPPNWTREFKWGTALVGAGLGIWWFARHVGGNTFGVWPFILGGMAILMGCVLGLPIASPFARAFRPVTTYGVSIPFVAVFPVIPGELTTIALKAGVVRALAFTPVMVLAGALAGWIFDFAPMKLALCGVKCAGLSVLAIPWLQVMNHSAGTTDASRPRAKTIAVLMVILGGFFGLVGGGVVAVFAPSPRWILGFALALLSSFGSAKLYMNTHAHLWFDLARPATEHS